MTEALGSEIHVIFAVDAPPVEHKDSRTLSQSRKKRRDRRSRYTGQVAVDGAG